MKKQDVVKFCVLAGVVIAAYVPSFVWMVGRWTTHDTYYSHGFLIPLICLFIIWYKREIFNTLKIRPAPKTGWLLFGGAAFIHIVSTVWRINFTSGFSLIPLLMGIVLIFWGWGYLRQLAFPISFIAFMVPLPMMATANISFRLKLFAARIATSLVNNLGIPAIQEGSMIKTRNTVLMVEDPCSGIRSLIALIALGALMSYFSQISKPKKIILFLSSIPIAIGTNIIRITALTMASEIYGSQFAMGWFHDTMGILVFVMAFVALALVSKVLE